MEKKRINPAWFVLVGIILIRGFAGGGINMSSGLFLAPVSDALGIGIGNLSLYFSITSLVMIFWLPIAGKLINKYDIRFMVAVAGALQGLSFAALGLMNNVFAWYLLAIPQAMGGAVLVNLLGPIMINRWFPNRTGFIMGVQMAFVSLFGAVLQPITSSIIANNGWRIAYYFVGLISFAVVIVSAFIFLKNRPQSIADKEKLPEPATATAQTAAHPTETAAAIDKKGGISEKTATRSASFGFLLVFMISITGVGVFTQHIPTYGALIGYTLVQVGITLSLTSLGSAIGAILIGIVSDKIGGLKTCYAVIFIWIFAIIGFLFSDRNFIIFAASGFLHGLVSSSIMVISPILTIAFFGKEDYEKIYAKVSMGAPLASILLIPAYGFIYDTTNSYFAVLLTLLVLLCVAFACITLGWKKRRAV